MAEQFQGKRPRELGISFGILPTGKNNAITDIDSRSGHDHSHDHHVGDDKFHLVHPDTKWEAGVEHGEKIGLGSRAYTLVRV